MKTPEEIKWGLECGFCHECPYDNNELETVEECARQVNKDAIAYIEQLEDAIDKTTQLMRSSTEVIKKSQEQLESTYSQVKKALCGKENVSLVEVLEAADQLKSRLAQAERERDAFEKCLKNVKDNLIFSSETYVGLKQNVYYVLMNIAQTLRELGRGFCEENTHDQSSV